MLARQCTRHPHKGVTATLLGLCFLLCPPFGIAQTVSTAPYLYMGVGACSAPQCHGRETPRQSSTISIQQNEYAHWLRQDKHARAFAVLDTPRSQLIARNLAMPEAPAKSDRCLLCHAMVAPRAQQGERYQLEDGVSCEACHGPGAEHAAKNGLASAECVASAFPSKAPTAEKTGP